jgi:hypothetical protein
MNSTLLAEALSEVKAGRTESDLPMREIWSYATYTRAGWLGSKGKPKSKRNQTYGQNQKPEKTGPGP